jgi:hypothetical protein
MIDSLTGRGRWSERKLLPRREQVFKRDERLATLNQEERGAEDGKAAVFPIACGYTVVGLRGFENTLE